MELNEPRVGELICSGESSVTIGRDGNNLTVTIPFDKDKVIVSYMTPDAALDFATALAVAAAVIANSKGKSN